MEQDPAADESAPTAITQAIQALLDRRGVPERKRLRALEAAVGIAYQQVRRRMMGETPWSVDEIKRLAAHFGEPVFRLLGALVDDVPGQPAVLQVGGAKLACSIWPGPEAAQGIGPLRGDSRTKHRMAGRSSPPRRRSGGRSSRSSG